MRTQTLVSPHEVPEREVAKILEEAFGAAWFPEHHRCSIGTDDAFVAVDVEFPARLERDEQQCLRAQLGFLPRTTLHLQSSTYHAGSAQLAEQVLQTLSKVFEVRVLSAA